MELVKQEVEEGEVEEDFKLFSSSSATITNTNNNKSSSKPCHCNCTEILQTQAQLISNLQSTIQTLNSKLNSLESKVIHLENNQDLLTNQIQLLPKLQAQIQSLIQSEQQQQQPSNSDSESQNIILGIPLETEQEEEEEEESMINNPFQGEEEPEIIICNNDVVENELQTNVNSLVHHLVTDSRKKFKRNPGGGSGERRKIRRNNKLVTLYFHDKFGNRVEIQQIETVGHHGLPSIVYECPLCPAKRKEKQHLRTHYNDAHLDPDKSYHKCIDCGLIMKLIPGENTLADHVEVCGKFFSIGDNVNDTS